LSIILLYLLEGNQNEKIYIFIFAIGVQTIYLIGMTIYLSKHHFTESKLFLPSLFADAFFLGGFSYLLGGMDSDIFMIIFFLIIYCALTVNSTDTVKISVFCTIIYTMAVAAAFKGDVIGFPIIKLVFRDILFICAGFGIAKFNFSAKEFDDLHREEFKIARTDKLTGLANRHYFEQKITEETNYADLTGKPLNVMLFDLDDFKLFNDTYGHPRGDKLLYLFSDIIRQNTRKTDIPVRYGGEEFLVIIRNLDIETAKSVGERIRSQLEKQRIYIGDDENKHKVTVSCGVAQYPSDSKDIKQVIEYADQALYAAKASGKNTVRSYSDCNKI